jgi:hypothetical protein
MTHVSMVMRCHDTETHPITFDEIWDAIRTGKHGLKEKITLIRNRYEAEKDITGSVEKAKKAIADLKGEIPGFLSSGTFSKRANESLVEYSGILCADLDSLGEKLPFVRESLKSYPFVHAIALSPSGDGLKVFFNVVNDPVRHLDSFRAIQQFMRAEAGLEIDEKCKDSARICFFTYDPDLWVRAEGDTTIPPADSLPRGKSTDVPPLPNLNKREQIAFGLLGELRPCQEKGGYFVRCPGETFHTNKTGEKHTILYLESVPTLSCQHESCGHAVEAFNKVLRSEIGKAEFLISHPLGGMRSEKNPNGQSPNDLAPEAPLVIFRGSKWFHSFSPPEGIQLIGDNHIVQDSGFSSVIAGPPGAGKSLGAMALAVAGSRGEGEFFGMKVHRKFKTLIIQTENGVYRLSKIFKELDCDALEEFVRVSEPPPYGLLFGRSDFREMLAAYIKDFAPDVVVVDPWNSVATDQEQRTYLDSLKLVRAVLPPNTALVIVAHTRKPQSTERASGRALMHMVAGSHVLVSVPRSVFVLQPATDDPEDDEVVWTCCKNNDGALGKRTAWKRKCGLFEPVTGFDWASFDADSKDKRVMITWEMIEEIFESGQLLRTEARDRLKTLSGASPATCYRALEKTGKFADRLIFLGKYVNVLPK